MSACGVAVKKQQQKKTYADSLGVSLSTRLNNLGCFSCASDSTLSPIPTKSKVIDVNYKGGKQCSHPELEETENPMNRGKDKLKSLGKLFVSQMSTWLLWFVDNLYLEKEIDKHRKMKQ